MHPVYEKLQGCLASIRQKTDFVPKVALILGSGLGDYAEEIEIHQIIPYEEIQGFPVSTVPGHKGRFVLGYVKSVPVIIMQGRVHYYEGYPITDVVLPVRLMKLLGAEILFLTNAAGGVNFDFMPGDFMMITDQISSFVPSPLIGPNVEELGERFSDMGEIYDKDLQKLLEDTAEELQIPLQKGIYIQFTGPNYESPAEVRMCRILGADAVGMSTACEAVAANHCGMKICGISCITNLACGMSETPLNHKEVQEIADQKAPDFKRLLTAALSRM
ncbi:MAG TPA: purine-nucleoside phosphorylase [Candidatus Blautia stercoravium]|nr:purine-nucleoside phosphorylase [Candidatus Blautia stercoravium]